MKKAQVFEITREERENNQSLIRRFTRRLRESGILSSARKAQFKDRPKSAQMQKRAALRKIEKRQEYEKTRKMSKPVSKYNNRFGNGR